MNVTVELSLLDAQRLGVRISLRASPWLGQLLAPSRVSASQYFWVRCVHQLGHLTSADAMLLKRYSCERLAANSPWVWDALAAEGVFCHLLDNGAERKNGQLGLGRAAGLGI